MSISSRLKLDKRTWNSCKYEINIDLTFSDGTVRKLESAQIIGVFMEKNFDRDHLPILMVDLALSKLDENKIGDDTLFHIRMDQHYLENNDDSREKRSKRIYINDTFVRLDPDSTVDTSEKLEKLSRKADKISEDKLSINDLSSKTTFVLVKKSDLELTKKMINAVLSGVNQETIVKYILVKGRCPNKVLMSNFTNKTTHNEIVLLPKPLLQQLLYLENEYGWHQEGTCIFIDYDTFYIVRMNGKASVWRKNEVTSVCFCISEVTSEDTIASGVILQNNILYVNIGTDQFRLADVNEIEDQTSGANVLLFNTTTGSSENVNSGTKGLDGTGAYSTKMYHGHNPYTKNQFVIRKKENSHAWEITCTNGDISFFTPNKQFSFLSDVTSIDKDLRGIYRISSIKVNFIKSGDYFDTTSSILVKRTEEK